MPMAQGQASNPRLERIQGGQNRVLVLFTEQADRTFVIPPGVTDEAYLRLEAANCDQQADTKMGEAMSLRARAKSAKLAADLLATNLDESQIGQACDLALEEQSEGRRDHAGNVCVTMSP
jgi:hypothetical protein